jgi:hypothetical protein
MTRKEARWNELKEMEALGLIRQQTFTQPLAYYGGQHFIDELEKKAALNRNEKPPQLGKG